MLSNLRETVTRSTAMRACVTVALLAGAASASVVTSIPDGTVVSMPAVNYFGSGPQVVAPGITWTSTNAGNQGGSVFGYTGTYGFLANGEWDGSLGPMAGVNDSFDAFGVTDTMTFSFATPVSAVGGFLNYVPGDSTPTNIAVYDAAGNLIESDTLTFSTSGGVNTGEFLGFQESTADIASFTLTDNYLAITNLTIASAVPEPGMFLPLAGLVAAVGLGLFRRKVRAQRASEAA
jgi:hypothetical protein